MVLIAVAEETACVTLSPGREVEKTFQVILLITAAIVQYSKRDPWPPKYAPVMDLEP